MQAKIFIINEASLVNDRNMSKKHALISQLTINGNTYADHIDYANRGKRSYALLCARTQREQDYDIPLALATITPSTADIEGELVGTSVDFSNIKVNRSYDEAKVLPILFNGTITHLQNFMEKNNLPPLAYAQVCIAQDSKITKIVEAEGFAPIAQTTKYHIRPDTIMVKPTNLTPEEGREYSTSLMMASTREETSLVVIKGIQKSIDNCEEQMQAKISYNKNQSTSQDGSTTVASNKKPQDTDPVA